MTKEEKLEVIREDTWNAVKTAGIMLKNPNFNTKYNFAAALNKLRNG